MRSTYEEHVQEVLESGVFSHDSFEGIGEAQSEFILPGTTLRYIVYSWKGLGYGPASFNKGFRSRWYDILTLRSTPFEEVLNSVIDETKMKLLFHLDLFR